MTSAVLDPERQFLGCLMQLAAEPARKLLAGMHGADLGSPVAAEVLQLAIELAAADQAPAPLALLDRAWEAADLRPRTGASHRLQHMSLWIADTYHHAPLALVSAPWLKSLVLKAAWRRAVREHGLRLVQGVDDGWPTGTLYAVIDDASRIDDLWCRYQAARDQVSDATRLEVAA